MLRITKLAISALFFTISRLIKNLRRMAGRRQAGTCVVLYYHNVPTDYRHRFEWQMQTLAQAWTAINLQQLSDLPVDSHSVAVTFDDALESFAGNAIPVLERFGVPATVFAVADAMGARPTWGDSYFPAEERVMSVQSLRSLPESITIGSHTRTHRDLTALSSAEAANEISGSRQTLESVLSRPITFLSFPFGAFDDSTLRQCLEAGYERAFTTLPELVSGDRFVVGRVAADPWDWNLEFRLKLTGAYCWQPWVSALRTKIKARCARIAGNKREGSVPGAAAPGAETTPSVGRVRVDRAFPKL